MQIIDDELFWRSRWKNLFKSLVGPILLVAFFTFIITLMISFIQSKNACFKNDINNLFMIGSFNTKENSNLREISTSVDDIMIDSIISHLNNQMFTGQWSAKSKETSIKDSNNREIGNFGNIYLQFSTNKRNNPELFSIILRRTKGKFVDYWQTLHNKIGIDNIEIFEKENTIVVKGGFISSSNYGKIFDKISYNNACETNITIEINKKYDNSSKMIIDYNNTIRGEINSSCDESGEVIEFNITLGDFTIENGVISVYSIIMSIICILSIINTIWINNRLNGSESYANSLSLFTVYGNVIWNAYGCLCHFFLTINYSKYFHFFILPTIFYFINFSISDLKLLYSLFLLKYSHLLSDQVLVRKKLLQLYFVFYLVMFFSLFFLTKFYFNKSYAFLGVSLTWIPQIIHNIIYKNKISLPWVYVIFTSIYRLFIPCYFRGYVHNFFLISPDYVFIIMCVLSMIFFIVVMYTQILFNGRWFLPKRFQGKKYDFYRTKEEILQIKPDANNCECVICLSPLFNNDTHTKYFSNDFTSEGDNENIQVVKDQERSSLKSRFKEVFNVLLNFHQKTCLMLKKKPFMLTPCSHAFHTPCLESWFERKKECPHCRNEIAVDY